jgi:predicted alpha/beta-fold hydrolase
MTIAPAFIPRRFSELVRQGKERFFDVEEGSRVQTFEHWHVDAKQRPTLVIIHGLEGSAESHYVLGLTEKAYLNGFNVLRVNVRNCGNTMHLCKTLYHSGLSHDAIFILRELQQEGFSKIFLAGCSMGGNISLKAAAELGDEATSFVSGICALSPALDLGPCVDQLETGFNRFYEQNFLRGLKDKIRTKQVQYPDIYDISQLNTVRSIRAFDDTYTAPHAGYGTAENYYRTASALPIIDQIRVPVLIIQSKDDPFVPFSSFLSPKLKAENITLIATKYGGHAGFVQAKAENPLFDRFWAENRIVEYCKSFL